MDELNENEREELGRLITEGFTSGRLDSEERHISWSLDFTVLDDA